VEIDDETAESRGSIALPDDSLEAGAQALLPSGGKAA
jgi:hypothetical protein